MIHFARTRKPIQLCFPVIDCQLSLVIANLPLFLSLAFSASASRSFGGAVVTNSSNSSRVIEEIDAIAIAKAASFAFEGFAYPLTFLTNCVAEASISSSVATGS